MIIHHNKSKSSKLKWVKSFVIFVNLKKHYIKYHLKKLHQLLNTFESFLEYIDYLFLKNKVEALICNCSQIDQYILPDSASVYWF
jgi:Na+/phosphate symporter